MPNFARYCLLAPTLLLALGLAACPGAEDPEDPVVETDAGVTEAPDSGVTEEPDAGLPVVTDAGVTGAPVTFKVMTWNVHNLYDDKDDPALVNQSSTTAGELLQSSTQVTTKLGKLATVIKNAAPDVLAVQEVETKDMLRRLNDKLGTAKLSYYELKDTKDPRGINVGIMSRFPILSVVSHAEQGFYHPNDSYNTLRHWPRDCLEVHLNVGGNRKVTLLVNHHTSAISDSNGMDREAQSIEARRIADVLRAQTPTEPVIIVGDLNSDEGSRPINSLTAGGGFADIGMRVNMTNRWTYDYNGDLQRLDYIIPDVTTAGMLGSITFLHTSAVESASDHHPVIASFTW